jgi:hypothetical protein
MILIRLAPLAIAASLSLACSSTTLAPAKEPLAPLEASYVTIVPDVSVSESAKTAELKEASVDPNSDVMAEIMAIPPGR